MFQNLFIEREKFNFDSQGSNIYDTLSNKALDSQYQSRNLMQLASHISETPDSGLLAMGALNPIAQGAANITNWGLRAAHGNPLAEKDIANYVSIDKLVDQMQREAASASGQHSYSAYDQASKSFPNTTKSKEGAIDNIANIIVNNKQNDDAKTFASKYQNEARSKNDTFARYTGQNLNQDFVNTYGPLYEHDRQSIGQMLRDKVTDPVSKEPISMFTYVMKYGDKLSDEAKVAIDRKYGKDGQPEILRYFPTVKQ